MWSYDTSYLLYLSKELSQIDYHFHQKLTKNTAKNYIILQWQPRKKDEKTI